MVNSVVNPGIVTSSPSFPPLVAILLLTIASVIEHKIMSESLIASGSFLPCESFYGLFTKTGKHLESQFRQPEINQVVL